MKGRTAKIVLSAVMALTIVSAGTVIAPVGDVIGGLTVSVSADGESTEDVIKGRYRHNDHYDDTDWSLNTETGVLTISPAISQDKDSSWRSTYTIDEQGQQSNNSYNVWMSEYVKEIYIRSGQTYTGGGSFSGYDGSDYNGFTKLEKVVFEEPCEVFHLGGHTFRNCSSIKEIDLPESIRVISDYAFDGCTSLEKITIPCSATGNTGNGYIFTNTPSLETLTLKKGKDGSGNAVTTVTYSVFNKFYRKKFTGIEMLDGVTRITGDALKDQTELKNITIPESLTTIGNGAFSKCASGMSLTIAEGSSLRLTADMFGSATDKVAEITQPDLTTEEIREYLEIFPSAVVNGQIAVELNLNGGSFVNDGVEASYIAATGAPLPDVVKEGAIFNGWYDNEALTGDPVTAVPDDAKGTMEYWAKWDDEIKFTGASLTLADDMALNFAVNGITADNCGDYTVRFEGKSVNDTSALELIDGRYCAVAHIYPKNIDETITATLYEGEEYVDSLEYSIADYLETVASVNEYTSAEQDLARATMLFGAAAAEYFYGGDHGYSFLFRDYCYVATTPINDEDIAYATSGHAFDNADAKISVVLDNKTSVCVYIKDVAAGTTAGGYTSIASNSTMKKQGYPSYFEISGLTPDQLGAKTTIVVDDKTYEFSALSWAHRVLNSGLPDDNKNVKLAKALVIYALEAESYIDQH